MMILSVLRPNAEHGACIAMSRVFILNVVMLNVVVPMWVGSLTLNY
jgi:hypothetical protein